MKVSDLCRAPEEGYEVAHLQRLFRDWDRDRDGRLAKSEVLSFTLHGYSAPLTALRLHPGGDPVTYESHFARRPQIIDMLMHNGDEEVGGGEGLTFSKDEIDMVTWQVLLSCQSVSDRSRLRALTYAA
jgi:hypothetical protein